MTASMATTVTYDDPAPLLRHDTKRALLRYNSALVLCGLALVSFVVVGTGLLTPPTPVSAALVAVCVAAAVATFSCFAATGRKTELDRRIASQAARELSTLLGETVPFLRVYAALGHVSVGIAGAAVLEDSSRWETASGLYEVLADHPVDAGTESVTLTVTRLRGSVSPTVPAKA